VLSNEELEIVRKHLDPENIRKYGYSVALIMGIKKYEDGLARSAYDKWMGSIVHYHPITPTFVDTTTGVRYEDMDRETIGSILKLNLK
jgi:hypothetical protein